MVKLTRIYTKGGDKGKTSLGNAARVSKSSLRIAAIGDLDEANSCIGVARLHAGPDIDLILSHLQNDLFDGGADLCVPGETADFLRIKPSQITFLEEKIDCYNESLPPLTSFVLPYGTPLSAHLHQARAVARRAERSLWALHEQEPLNLALLQYVNRLSDLLFVLARYANLSPEQECLWVPGQHFSQ